MNHPASRLLRKYSNGKTPTRVNTHSPIELPARLAQLLRDSSWQADTLGESTAQTYRVVGKTENFYLKVSPVEPLGGLQSEADALAWLRPYLPAPEVVYFERTKGIDYLLMREIVGLPASSDQWKQNPRRLTQLLAETTLALHSLPIEACPFNQRIDTKIQVVSANVRLGLVNEDDFDEETMGQAPEQILGRIRMERPAFEDLVVTHGDLCLPNILVQDWQLSGFIDVGALGVSDRYQDLAVCTGCLADYLETDDYTPAFFAVYGLTHVDTNKLRYYRLLNELL